MVKTKIKMITVKNEETPDGEFKCDQLMTEIGCKNNDVCCFQIGDKLFYLTAKKVI